MWPGRCSDEKITNILVKIAKFVATVNKQVFKMPKRLHQSFYKLAILGKKIVTKSLWKKPLKIAKMVKNRQIWSHCVQLIWRLIQRKQRKITVDFFSEKIFEGPLSVFSWHVSHEAAISTSTFFVLSSRPHDLYARLQTKKGTVLNCFFCCLAVNVAATC